VDCAREAGRHGQAEELAFEIGLVLHPGGGRADAAAFNASDKQAARRARARAGLSHTGGDAAE
jgi:hypothetical protein